MHLRGLVLLLLSLPGSAHRSIRIDHSHHVAQQQNNMLTNGLEASAELQETLIPWVLRPGLVRSVYPPAGDLLEGSKQDDRSGMVALQAARAKVALQAPSGQDHMPPKEDLTPGKLPPLSDRIFLVTGATDGIGEFTAELLAKANCTVLVHGRNPSKVGRLVEKLSKWSPGKTHGFVADLSLLTEVRRLGAEVSAAFPVIHGLLNNAGTFSGDYSGRRKVTAEGNEYSLAVNVLAPFLLTSLLLENVKNSSAGRVIITSSISAGSNDALGDLQCEKRWDEHRAYELSKLCAAMIIAELDKRYGDPPRLVFHTMDPGTVDTKMLRAGWWSGGASVRTATNSFMMLTEDRLQETSGEGRGYCRGEGEASRQRLWQQLEALTGAQWP